MTKPLQRNLILTATVGVAFFVAIAVGFWIHRDWPGTADGVLVGWVLSMIVGPPTLVAWLITRVRSTPVSSGYALTFHDFRRLVTEPSSQPLVAPLIREWFGIGLSASLDLTELHRQIQSDPAKQYAIYQRAMDLWR
jgi:hypothetical protein